MARPRLKIDPEQVAKAARMHCTNREIASLVGCSEDTLTRRFADVLAKEREKGKARLRRLQWQAAEGGRDAMLIWLGKQYLGQVDSAKLEISHNASAELAIMLGVPVEALPE